MKVSLWIKALLLSICAWLMPIKPLIIAVGALCIIDCIVGTYASWKRGNPITSSGWRRTVVKLTLFQVGLLSAFILEGVVGFHVSKLLASIICVTEVKSLIENIDEISGSQLWVTIKTKLGSENDLFKVVIDKPKGTVAVAVVSVKAEETPKDRP